MNFERPAKAEKKDFALQLASWIKQNKPDLIKTTKAEYDELRERAVELENLIDDAELLEVLERYGIDVSKLEPLKDGLFRVKILKHFSDKHLPEGYAYSGGGARSLLVLNLMASQSEPPRDLDVVRLSKSKSRSDADKAVAKEFMPEDFEHGHGVDVIADLTDYFDTRDLTINEVIADDQNIIATRQCILDTVRGVIRLTEYEMMDFSPTQKGKLLSKIIRFYSEAIHQGRIADLPNMTDYVIDELFIHPFWIALNLDKAMQKGRVYAEAFLEQIKKLHQLPDDVESVEDAATYLCNQMVRWPFHFRHAEKRQHDIEERWMLEDMVERKSTKRSNNNSVKKLIRYSK